DPDRAGRGAPRPQARRPAGGAGARAGQRAAGTVAGPPDPALVPAGGRLPPQSRHLGGHRAGGLLLRARRSLQPPAPLGPHQTAEVLAGTLHVDAIEEDCDLCEVHPGQAIGLPWDEYRARYGAFNLLASPDRPFAPGGESWSAFLDRVRKTHRRLATRFARRT